MSQTIYKREIVGEIEKYLYTGDIVVLHGARQVGKTSLLRYFESELKARGERAYFIDLEDSRYVKILDSGVLEFLKLLEEEGVRAARPNKKAFVFIDEIQYLANPSSFLKLVAEPSQRHQTYRLGFVEFCDQIQIQRLPGRQGSRFRHLQPFIQGVSDVQGICL